MEKEKGGSAEVKEMKRGGTSTKDKYMKAKNCLMNDGWELYTLCGNPLCIILFDPHSQHPQTWPSSSVAVNSVIHHYKSTAASAPGKKKYVNLTLSDIGLIPPNKPWEKDLHPAMLDFPLQELVAINGKIDHTLSKIDALLMTPTVGGEFQTASGCDSDTDWSSIVRMLESDDGTQFPGEGSASNNNALYTCAGQNQDLFPGQMPLLSANPQGLFGWNNQPPGNGQVQFQMHECCNDLDWYS